MRFREFSHFGEKILLGHGGDNPTCLKLLSYDTISILKPFLEDPWGGALPPTLGCRLKG